MAPTKKFASYATKLAAAIQLLETEDLSRNGKKALTIIKKIQENAEKFSGNTKDGAPKKKVTRKLNDYMIFANENRERVAAELGHPKVTEVAKRLGELWKIEKAKRDGNISDSGSDTSKGSKKAKKVVKKAPVKKAPAKK